MRFFGLKTCDTCRKALISLRQAGYDPVVTDVRADGIGAAELERIVAIFGDGAVNRASATWRGLDQGAQAMGVAELIGRHPTVMKRPVIEAGGVWTIGWDTAVRARWGC